MNNDNGFDVITDKMLGKGVPFQRVRRITGYLAYVESFNNGKRAELLDRVRHSPEYKGHCCS